MATCRCSFWLFGTFGEESTFNKGQGVDSQVLQDTARLPRAILARVENIIVACERLIENGWEGECEESGFEFVKDISQADAIIEFDTLGLAEYINCLTEDEETK